MRSALIYLVELYCLSMLRWDNAIRVTYGKLISENIAYKLIRNSLEVLKCISNLGEKVAVLPPIHAISNQRH